MDVSNLWRIQILFTFPQYPQSLEVFFQIRYFLRDLKSNTYMYMPVSFVTTKVGIPHSYDPVYYIFLETGCYRSELNNTTWIFATLKSLWCICLDYFSGPNVSSLPEIYSIFHQTVTWILTETFIACASLWYLNGFISLLSHLCSWSDSNLLIFTR